MGMVKYECHVGMKLYHVRGCVDIPDLVVDVLYYFIVLQNTVLI